MKIGITERGDAGIDLSWKKWVEKGKPAVLISKHIPKLYEAISALENPNIIVHCNITGLGGTEYEPFVPSANESIPYLFKIVELLGEERVVLRIDPIFLDKELAERALSVKRFVSSSLPNLRCRISFVDNYKHVQKRFEFLNLKQIDYRFHGKLEDRKKLWEIFGKPDTCGEPGLPSVGCISKTDCQILGVEPEDGKSFQRKECTCLPNKKELLKECSPCENNCKYCYWMTPEEKIYKNKKHDL